MLRVVSILAIVSAVAACSEFEGPEPPADALYYPVGIAVHPTGDYLYVANANFDAQYRSSQGGTVVVLDAHTLRVLPETTVQIGSFGGGLALNRGRDGASAPDRLYVTVRGDNSLVALSVSEDGATIRCPNAATGDPTAHTCRVQGIPNDPFAVEVLPSPEGLDSERDIVAVASLTGYLSAVSVTGDDSALDTDNAYVTYAPAVSGAAALRRLPNTGEAWVAGRFSRRLRGLRPVPAIADDGSIRASSGELAALVVTSEALLPSPVDTTEVRDFVFSEDGQRAWVSTGSPAAITFLDMAVDATGSPRGTVLDRFDLDSAPAQLTLARESGRARLYVAVPSEQAIDVIDAETGALLDRITLDGLVYSMAYHQPSARLYVTLFDEHTVVAIDLDPSSPTFRHIVGRTQ